MGHLDKKREGWKLCPALTLNILHEKPGSASTYSLVALEKNKMPDRPKRNRKANRSKRLFSPPKQDIHQVRSQWTENSPCQRLQLKSSSRPTIHQDRTGSCFEGNSVSWSTRSWWCSQWRSHKLWRNPLELATFLCKYMSTSQQPHSQNVATSISSCNPANLASQVPAPRVKLCYALHSTFRKAYP